MGRNFTTSPVTRNLQREGGRDLREGALIPPCQGPGAAGIIAEEEEEEGADAQIYS
jgi:hypothetical protein